MFWSHIFKISGTIMIDTYFLNKKKLVRNSSSLSTLADFFFVLSYVSRKMLPSLVSVRNAVQFHQPKNSLCQRVLRVVLGPLAAGCSGSAAEGERPALGATWTWGPALPEPQVTFEPR